MIKSHDRSGWFGASDTSHITGNWGTRSFFRWWAVKCGIITDNFTTRAMMAGTHYEHKILEAVVPGCRRDRQVKLRRLRLRVNLDGDKNRAIFEVKTHKNDFRLTKAYVQQVQVQMFATGLREAYIIAYRVTEAEYENYFLPIEIGRISIHKIEYDEEFIRKTYLPRLIYLRDCLRKGALPDEPDYRKRNQGCD